MGRDPEALKYHGRCICPSQLSAHCSLQTGRKQPREILLQNYKFPTIAYLRPPRPRKTDQQITVIPSGAIDSTRKDLTLSSSKEAKGANGKGRINCHGLLDCPSRTEPLKVIWPLLRTQAQRRKMICSESLRQVVAEPGLGPKFSLSCNQTFHISSLPHQHSMCVCINTYIYVHIYIHTYERLSMNALETI